MQKGISIVDLTERKIEGDPAKAVEVLAQKIGANEGERGNILRALIEGGDTTAWGLTNAVTAQAHGGSYDRAVEFAQAGGSLLNLPKAEWKEILEAAETHSAALARALAEARDELLECKADYHRNPSSVIDKCNAVLAEARSLLAPKEDTDA